jgi:hypothetical protein
MTDTPKKLIVDVAKGTQDLCGSNCCMRLHNAIKTRRLMQKQKQIAQSRRRNKGSTLKDSAKAKLVAGEPLTEEEAATLII